jgi:hypothetical protein
MRKTQRLIVFALVVIALIVSRQIEVACRGVVVVAQESEQINPDELRRAQNWRFIADDKGIVTDTKTGLEWFVGPDSNTTWDEAKSWVETLSVDGGRWRMPSREELKSLYTKGVGIRNMSPLFKTTGSFVWTGETVGSLHAWGFCFEIGSAYWPRRDQIETARGFAVRSGK